MDIANEMKQILSKMTGMEVEEINEDDNLIDDLGIDSLKVIEIATQLEKTYRVKVKESQMAQIKTVRDTINVLGELLEAANAPK
ncbi:acyl carrier protein [Elusimicrobiota bacterium]